MTCAPLPDTEAIMGVSVSPGRRHASLLISISKGCRMLASSWRAGRGESRVGPMTSVSQIKQCADEDVRHYGESGRASIKFAIITVERRC